MKYLSEFSAALAIVVVVAVAASLICIGTMGFGLKPNQVYVLKSSNPFSKIPPQTNVVLCVSNRWALVVRLPDWTNSIRSSCKLQLGKLVGEVVPSPNVEQ